MRERFGIGQEVHVSILSSALNLLYCNIIISQVGGFEVPRHTRAKEHPLRNYCRCADDRWLIMTLPPNKQQDQWKLLCQTLGHPELENDPRFSTVEKRSANAEQLVTTFD